MVLNSLLLALQPVLRQASLACLAIGLSVCGSLWAQATAPANLGQPLTRLVEASTEAIAEPFPSVDALPKTISFDAMTEAEIQQWRQDVFDYNLRVSGGIKCMRWFFLREGKDKPWKTIGAFTFIKVNGAYRNVIATYSIEPGKSRWITGKQVPGKEPGRGSATVWYFNKKQSFAQIQRETEDRDLNVYDKTTENKESAVAGAFFADDANPKLRKLTFGSTRELRISDKKMPCTHVKATCRRFSFPFTNAYWEGPYSNSH
jgi:hypothetical protein